MRDEHAREHAGNAGEGAEESELMGLYAVVREEAQALSATRAQLDQALARLEALEATLKAKGIEALGQTQKDASEGARLAFAQALQNAALPTMQRLDQSVNGARRALSSSLWAWTIAALFAGLTIGIAGMDRLYRSDDQSQLAQVLDSQAAIWQAIKEHSQVKPSKQR